MLLPILTGLAVLIVDLVIVIALRPATCSGPAFGDDRRSAPGDLLIWSTTSTIPIWNPWRSSISHEARLRGPRPESEPRTLGTHKQVGEGRMTVLEAGPLELVR